MEIKFNDRLYISTDSLLITAISGSAKQIAEQLKLLASQIESQYGKPVQGLFIAADYDIQIITPVWNGRKY